jgi:L-threonylcarbamoyladenylate synthase
MTAPLLPADQPDSIARAVEILRAGGLVAMPTETVYGLAADASNPAAIARLYEAKGRPRFNPLIAHVSGAEMARNQVEWPDLAGRLADRFWPGPLSLVLPRRKQAQVCDLAGAGLDTLAVRAPDHPAAQALIEAFGGPLCAPSANPSGKLSPTQAGHVAEGLGDRIDLILDGGPCRAGLESSVLALQTGHAALLRPGAIARADLIAMTGPLLYAGEAGAPASPGMLKSHYAPNAALRLQAEGPETGETYIGFGPSAPAGSANLSEKGDLVEAAAKLFSLLRQLDAEGAKRIAVAPIPNDGLGEAINDRLARAAAPRGLTPEEETRA